MRYPSVKTIETRLDVERDVAKKIRGLMDGSLDPWEDEGTGDLDMRCFSRIEGWEFELSLALIDRLLENHGVEGWCGCDGSVGVSYSNAGDPYVDTVAYVGGKWSGRWYVCGWEYLATRFPQESF